MEAAQAYAARGVSLRCFHLASSGQNLGSPDILPRGRSAGNGSAIRGGLYC